mgnify:CR=1 FL=1
MLLPLVLDPVARSDWRRFVEEGSHALARVGAAEHWQRCVDLGVPAKGPNPEDVLERGAALRERHERIERLLSEGNDIIEQVAAVAAMNDYSLVVSDADGVLVSTGGGGAFESDARKFRVLEGSHWSEAMRGTNAIGTALALDRPVFVRGSAHFALPYQELICYAAPVRDPEGRIVAVVDATSYFQREDVSMGFGVVAAARALEEVVRLHAYGRAGASVARLLVRSLERMDCPVVLVEASGRVARWNSLAQAWIGKVGRSFYDYVGLAFADILAYARRGETIEVVGNHVVPAHRLRFEPLTNEADCFAVLVFFEPVASGLARSSAELSRAASGDLAGFAREGFFAEDRATIESLGWAARIARTGLPVMLVAETGAGKELVARGIHRQSPCANGPFVAINCAAIAPTLLESELFGYAPGAFTGADKLGHEGHVGAAAGGTLFLDEVAEMPLAMQATLLRFLESGEYRRVGDTTLRHAAARIICATCRKLEELVACGAFRQDLYYRLKGALVTLPPLRERTDTAALARHLVGESAARFGLEAPSLSIEVEAFFSAYPWPGNIRELKATVEVAMLLVDSCGIIELRHLPPDLRLDLDLGQGHDLLEADAMSGLRGQQSLADLECEAIRRALALHSGNISRVARELGVARSTIYRMLRKCGG